MSPHWHIGIQPAISFLLLLLIVGTILRLIEVLGAQSSSPIWVQKLAAALGFIY